MTIAAWMYMVETDDGLTKRQINQLMDMIPNEVEVLPFTNDIVVEGSSLLDANSIAYGFLDNDYYDDMLEIQEALAEICNDWEKEHKESIYTTKNGLKILMIHDGHGQQINIERLFS